MAVSVCIATYRRAARLRQVLEDMVRQHRGAEEGVVVDNDAEGSGRAVVDELRASGVPFRLDYAVQPERNIALTRNRTVALATGDWLAFLDDDEGAPEAWLSQLMEGGERHRAAGVLGA